MRPLLRPALALAVLGSLACGGRESSVMVAGTTSTYDSGLLEALVSEFEASHPEHRVRVIVVGSGEALELGRRGDVDLLLVHAPDAESRFVRAGHGVERLPVMYNDFVIVGPERDPAGVRSAGSAAAALAAVHRAGEPFVSRGDSSGTHMKEMELWAPAEGPSAARAEAGSARAASARAGAGDTRIRTDRTEADWYRETGQGQAESLQVADERQAYTLVDRATYLTLERVIDLEILYEGDPALRNVYSTIVVSNALHPEGARVFAGWLSSEAGRTVIAEFGRVEHGRPLFHPIER